MPAKQSIIGLTFGKLAVLSEAATRRSPQGRALRFSVVQCACGSPPFEVRNECLTSGHTQSCGCLQPEAASKANTKHGMSGPNSPTYHSWTDAKGRCFNPNNKSYERWGGRGIKMCDGFRNSYERFFAILGECPKGHIIDRIGNDLHYSCGECKQCLKEGWKMNCKWSTYAESMRNTSRTRNFTILGVSGCMTDLCAHFGVNMITVHNRLKRGWLPERAFTEPARPRKQVG